MATAAALIEDLESGDLPRICAKTGAPAEVNGDVVFRTAPGWTWILLLFGLLPFLIARAFAARRVRGLVPLSRFAHRRARIFRWTVLGVSLAGIAIFFSGSLGVGFSESGILLLLLMVITGPLVWPFVGLVGRIEGDWIWLSRVHPRFAEALGHRYAGRFP